MVKIGEMLVALSACPPEAVQQALHNQTFSGGRLGTNLLELGAVEEERLADALGRMFRMPSAWGAVIPDPRAIALLGRPLVERLEVVPYALDGRTVRLLVCDPSDVRAIDEVSFALGKVVKPIITPQARIWALMRQHYGIERGLRGVEVGAEAQRRWAPTLQAGPRFARPLADDIW